MRLAWVARASALMNTAGRKGETVDIAEEKKMLRKRVIARRNAMDPAERERKSAIICQTIVEQLTECFGAHDAFRTGAYVRDALAADSCANAGPHASDGAYADDTFRVSASPVSHMSCTPMVGLFSALGSEVDLRDVVRHARVAGWSIALPVMVTQEEDPGYTMLFVQVDYETALSRQEPFLAKPAKNIDPASFDFQRFSLVRPWDLDALVMPLVAFDAQGGRLGYGGGNYDRYLPQLRPDCWVSGVAFEEQRAESVPRAGFDLAIPQVISA